jgi:RimJ/RimL family protein N-acetyltransferase
MDRVIDLVSGRRVKSVKLKPIDSSDLLELVAGWLSQKANYQWLGFDDGQQVFSSAWLRIMTQQQSHLLRVFTAAEDDRPIGLVGLSEINQQAKTARIWIATGDKSFRARGYATEAISAMLTLAFREYGLEAVNTWIVEHNPSRRIAERVGFKFIGRQRECHYINGQPFNRLWFDILPSEHNAS